MEKKKVNNLEFDKDRGKYYFIENDIKKYLSCGNKIQIIYEGEIKIGIVEYSTTIGKGYYLLLDNNNYIPLFLVKKIKIL
jgi:hypothetical protein